MLVLSFLLDAFLCNGLGLAWYGSSRDTFNWSAIPFWNFILETGEAGENVFDEACEVD